MKGITPHYHAPTQEVVTSAPACRRRKATYHVILLSSVALPKFTTVSLSGRCSRYLLVSDLRLGGGTYPYTSIPMKTRCTVSRTLDMQDSKRD